MANPQNVPRPLTPQERADQANADHQGRLELAYRRKPGISRTIVEFFETHTDRAYSVESIAANTGLPLASVKSAMSKLVRAGHVLKGQVSGMYHSAGNGNESTPGPHEGDTLNIIRVRPDGDIVLMDTHGTFWVATPVDI
jgi:hypothetical protein